MSQDKKDKKPGIGTRIVKWFRGLISELKKVTWPSRSQIMNNTWVVLVVMGVCAVAIWGFDYVAGTIVRTLINVVG
ncbi:MAG: preprotein translocase subunit SecE [Oscillospiraceae bacterium]|nr:preprotein translocase subunit SecE [Oscillospiraceae bacterium]